MKRLSRIGIVGVACALTFGAVAYGATITPQIFVNNNKVKTSLQPKIIDGTVYVPIRSISDGFGTSITWDNDRKAVYVNSEPEFKQENSSVTFVWKRNLVHKFIMAYDERNYDEVKELVTSDFKTDIYLAFPGGTLNMGSIVDIKTVSTSDNKFTVQIVQRVSAEDDYKIKVENWEATLNENKIQSIMVVPQSTKYLDRYTVAPGATFGIPE